MNIKTLKEEIEKLVKENDERIEQYVKNGGKEHDYLDGKATALEEVLLLLGK